MTGNELFDFGTNSREARCLIHRALGHSLPRLGYVHGRLVAEYWYFSVGGTERSAAEYIKKYAVIDLQTEEILVLKSVTSQTDFSESWETGYLTWRFRRARRYLNRCVRLLDKPEISDEDLKIIRRRWFHLQPKWIRANVSRKMSKCI